MLSKRVWPLGGVRRKAVLPASGTGRSPSGIGARDLILALAAMSAVLGAGHVVLPRAWQAWQLRAAADDPAALASLRLRDGTLTANRVEAEIAAAVAADDEDLARSFVTLAQAHGIPVSAEQLARVAALEKSAARRAARDVASGFITGDADSPAALAGALTGDVVGYGDLRDLWLEGRKMARGEEVDDVVVGLAAVGLAITAGTWATLGSALPARGGVTAIKIARRTGRLSKPLAASLGRTMVEVVDKTALQSAVSAARRLEIGAARAAARRAVRPGALGRLTAFSDDAAKLYARTGHRGVMQTLALAENTDDVRRAARLSAAHGTKTRAILKVLGRGALILGAALSAVVTWTFAALAWIFGAAVLARGLGLWLGRRLWRRPVRAARVRAAATMQLGSPALQPSG